MNRLSIFTVLLGLLIFSTASAQKTAEVGSLGLGASGGLVLPISGDVTSDSSFSDYFGSGPAFGAHANNKVMEQLTLQGGFDYAYSKMKDEAIDQEAMSGEPYWVAPHIYLNGIWNMSALFTSETNAFNPYLLAGGGLYFWKVTDDGAGGDAVVLDENGEEFSKTSFGMQFGGGLEFFTSPDLSFFAEGKYHMVFTEDTETFGEDFGNLAFVGLKAGLTYHLPLGSK